jgi:hypothetical protein
MFMKGNLVKVRVTDNCETGESSLAHDRRTAGHCDNQWKGN